MRSRKSIPLKAAVAADEKGSQQIVDTVRKLIEPKSWAEPDACIGLVPGAIVVRQTPSVHRRIQSLLNAIEYTTGRRAAFKPHRLLRRFLCK